MLFRSRIGHSCPSCEGIWIPSFEKAEWLEEGRRRRYAGPARSLAESGEPACPECLSSLTSALAGTGLRFRVEHCRRCGGFWMPAESRGRLKGAEWDTEVPAIFKTLWSRERAENRKQREESAFPSRLPQGGTFNQISRRKEFHAVSERFREYLGEYGRLAGVPRVYDELMEFTGGFPCYDRHGEDTLWQTVTYDPDRQKELNVTLSRTYSQLKTGDPGRIEHIYIERVDFCEFGNSKPFRVRVVNQFNDNYDHFYVKIPDASRIYGLELEHLLSPNWMNYLVHQDTLIEEHIAGIPGDVFIRDYLTDPHLNRVRVAKEFVKFNERAFCRLLGDMRSYNYVLDITPDFEETQYRVRAIDFDQQSYEGNRNMYLPQFFRENAPVVKLCTELLNYPTMQQYQTEERTLILKRFEAARERTEQLLDCMSADELSLPEKVAELRDGLGDYHKTEAFAKCESMGELVRMNLRVLLEKKA